MTHGDAITNPDDPELKGYTAGSGYTFPHLHRECPEMDMAGDDIVPGIGHPDERPVELPLGDPQ
jgi:hypothetical protein